MISRVRSLDAPSAVFAAAAAVSAVLLYRVGSGASFRGDEFASIILMRSFGDLFSFHYDAVQPFLFGAYQLLATVFGFDSYGPYTVAGVVAHIVLVALVYAYVRRRCGGWVAAAAGVFLLWFGPGFLAILVFEHAYTGSFAGGVAALLLLDRKTRAGDVGAALALVVAVLFGSWGIVLALGVGVELLLARERRRFLVVAAPLATYAAMWLAARPDSSFAPVRALPRFVFDAAAASLGELVGLSLSWGRPLVVVAVVAVAVILVRRGRVEPRLAALISMPVLALVLIAAKRAHLEGPNESRYFYPMAVLYLLIGAELLGRQRVPRAAVAVAGVVAAAAFASNVQAMRAGGDELRDEALVTRSELAAADIARDHVSGTIALPYFDYFTPEYPGLPTELYFDAVDDFGGSPAATPSELLRFPEERRRAADELLLAILPVELEGDACTRVRRFADGWTEVDGRPEFPPDRADVPWRTAPCA